MKLQTVCFIGLATALGISVSAGLPAGWLSQAPADSSKACRGETCNDQDPIRYRCDEDAVVVEEFSQTVLRLQDDWQPREIIVQKLFSSRCQASWVNAYIPDDTFLFIREQAVLNGTQPVRGMIQADGTEYFWAQSGMSNGDVVNQGCISLPILSTGIGHELYEQYCTEFS